MTVPSAREQTAATTSATITSLKTPAAPRARPILTTKGQPMNGSEPEPEPRM